VRKKYGGKNTKKVGRRGNSEEEKRKEEETGVCTFVLQCHRGNVDKSTSSSSSSSSSSFSLSEKKIKYATRGKVLS